MRNHVDSFTPPSVDNPEKQQEVQEETQKNKQCTKLAKIDVIDAATENPLVKKINTLILDKAIQESNIDSMLRGKQLTTVMKEILTASHDSALIQIIRMQIPIE